MIFFYCGNSYRCTSPSHSVPAAAVHPAAWIVWIIRVHPAALIVRVHNMAAPTSLDAHRGVGLVMRLAYNLYYKCHFLLPLPSTPLSTLHSPQLAFKVKGGSYFTLSYHTLSTDGRGKKDGQPSCPPAVWASSIHFFLLQTISSFLI